MESNPKRLPRTGRRLEEQPMLLRRVLSASKLALLPGHTSNSGRTASRTVSGHVDSGVPRNDQSAKQVNAGGKKGHLAGACACGAGCRVGGEEHVKDEDVAVDAEDARILDGVRVAEDEHELRDVEDNWEHEVGEHDPEERPNASCVRSCARASAEAQRRHTMLTKG